ncbi:MAG: hypothetical protein IKY37_05265 [Bacteroidaceae bacterium]|nr:hypothetical protein [Bacteroidaceae bacterium]
MKSKNIIYHFVVLILAIAFAGCENGYDCYLENIAYNRIGFYKSDSTDIKYSFPEALTVSLMVNGKDSITVNHIENTDNLILPMSYTQECDTVIFSYQSSITDTLYIFHENIPFYQSMECGTIMYHKLNNIEHTRRYIDSVAIAEEYVKFDANENVKIFFTE